VCICGWKLANLSCGSVHAPPSQVVPTLALYDTMQYVIALWLCTRSQVVPTLALYDTMQYVRSKTATVCYGMCLGMGGFLLTAGGEKVSAARKAWAASCSQRVLKKGVQYKAVWVQ